MKVGDYARTIYGQITKVKYKWEKLNISQRIIKVTVQCEDDELYDYPTEIKTSPNRIDLIEVGDYVNGSKVVRIEKHNEELYVYVQETEYCNACDEEENIYKNEDIKSIVTKEQFSQMEYRIGE